LDIGNPSHIIEQYNLREMVAPVFQQHDSSNQLVRGEDITQQGDHHVVVTILVNVHNGGVRRHLQAVSEDRGFPVSALLILKQHNLVPRSIADENVIHTVDVEVNDLHMGDAVFLPELLQLVSRWQE